MPEPTKQKSFLLLQGVASPFFNELERALVGAKHRCLKINFCGGDLHSGQYFSKANNYLNYVGKLDDLAAFYQEQFNQHTISDIVLFGDTRPVHKDAIDLANKNNIRVHVFEEGYFRPNWVTMDQGGVNINSAIYKESQNKAEWFLNQELDENWKETSLSSGGNLLTRGWYDIRFHLTSWLLKKKFPHYKTHRPDSPLAEYWGFLRRIPLVTFFHQDRSNQIIRKLLNEQTPYYLLPLQLNADSQIRLHSNFADLSDVIKTTLKSFAKNASTESTLVIKLHPLDPWIVNYKQVIKEYALAFKIKKTRIIYLEAGDLDKLLTQCQGTVLVNSTVGISSIAHNCPVIALGKAIYNIEGLSYQGKLDNFWQQAASGEICIDKTLFAAFRQCYIKRTQINGSFYNRKGINMAVKNSMATLLS